MTSKVSSADEAAGARLAARVLPWLYGAAAAVFVWAKLGREPYDDSYFFKRIALNFLDRGSLAWNVDEGPVYGATSQTFQLCAVAIAALTRDHFMLAVRVLLLLCLLLAFRGLLALTQKYDRGAAATYALCSPVALYMPLSGMETAFALAISVAFLGLVYAPRAQALHFALAPLVAVLLYATRPDALLLAAPTLLLERFRTTRRLPWREACVLAGLLLGLLTLFRFAYGTALPLPFYAKTALLSPYDAHFLAVSGQIRQLRFGLFLAVAFPLFLAGFAQRDKKNLILLGSVVAYEVYLYLSTVEIMGMQGRFYAPALPWLVLAAARGLAVPEARPRERRRAALWVGAQAGLLALLLASHSLPLRHDWRMDQVAPALAVSTALGALVLLSLRLWPQSHLAPASIAGLTLVLAFGCLESKRGGGLDDEAYLRRHMAGVTSYRGMAALKACLGEQIHVYHSEVGVTGLRFQAGKVTDLAGLLSPRWLFRGARSFDDFCERERPAAIFLPHRNYQTQNSEILTGRCIANYRRVIKDSSSPLYVRRDLLADQRRCFDQASARD